MSHPRFSLFALAAAMVLAACSGGGQPSLTPSQSSELPSASTRVLAQSAATGSIQSSGTITSLQSNGFVMQTGSPHGYVVVTTSSSTVITGKAPYVGESVSVSANGSFSTALIALTVTQITASPSPIASATPVASIPTHITTWGYDEYWSVGANATAAQVRQYLSFAQSGLGNAKAANDCHLSGVCKSVFYFDPHMFYDTAACGSVSADVSGILANATEGWYVHESGYSDSAHRVRGTYAETCNGKPISIPVYAMNTLNASLQTYYRNYLHTNAANFDDFFLDDTSGQVLTQFYGAGGGFCQDSAPNHWCSSTQEMPTDASVVSEHAALANSLTHPDGTAMPGVYNGLNFSNGRPNDLTVLQSSSKFIGAVCEDCVVSSGTFRPTMYAEVLNAMAEIDAIANASFVELNNGVSAPGSSAQIAQRTATTAIAWLGYSQGHTIVWPNLEANTQSLAVFPENSIYPSSPLQTMSSSGGAADIAVSTGVYRREFAACYNAGTPIGPCAALINANGTNVTISSTWLHQTYGHVVQLVGADIPSGGHTVLTSVAFTPNATTLAPSAGILLVR